MKCSEVMQAPVQTCSQDSPVSECAQLMRDRGVGIIPLLDESNAPIGILTDRDIALKIVAEGQSADTKASQAMSGGLLTCSPDDDLSLAEQRMAENRKSRILVTNDDGSCAGIISLSDLSGVEQSDRVGELLGQISKREVAA